MPIYSNRYISNDILSSAVSSSFKYIPSNPRELEQRGQLFGLVTVIGQDGIQADRISKFVWDSIVDSYFFSPFSSVIDSLKKAVLNGSRKAVDLIKNDKGAEVNLSFSLALFKGKGAYLTVYGEQELFMYKNGGIVKVSEVILQNKGVVVSVAWTERDILLMSSPNLLSSVVESISLGDSNDEVASNILESSYNFSGYQSILLLSSKEYIVRKSVEVPEDNRILTNEIEPENNEIGKIENSTESENEIGKPNAEVVENFILKKPISLKDKLAISEIDREKFVSFTKKIFFKLKNIFTVLASFFEKMTLKIGNTFALIFGRLRESIKGLYGNKQWYRRIMSKFSFASSGRRNIKIDGYKEVGLRNRRFGILFLLIILAILVFVGAKLSMNAKIARTIHKEAVVLMDDFEGSLDIAQKNLLTDPEVSALELFELDSVIKELSIKKLSLDDSKRYSQLFDRYTQLDDRINNRVGLSEESGNIELFLDGRSEFGELAELTDITYYKDEFQNNFLLVVERNEGIVYKINLDNKKIEKLPDSKNVIKKPTFIDYGVGGVYVFDQSKGVLKASFGKGGIINTFVPVAGLDSDVIGDISVDDFAIITSNDNVYFLSKSEKSILKANRSGSGYTLPFDFVSSKTFTGANNLANDISIYVLTQGEKGIERYAFNYTKGKTTLLPVTTVGLVPDFGNIIAGYTGSLSDSNLFVFDQTNERLIMLEKPIESGQNSRHPNQMVLLSQYIYRGGRTDVFKNVKELASDYNDEYVYVLDGNTILKVRCK